MIVNLLNKLISCSFIFAIICGKVKAVNKMTMKGGFIFFDQSIVTVNLH